MKRFQSLIPHPHRTALLALYGIAFLYGLHTALPLYVNSSFMSGFLSESAAGIAYAVASGLSLVALVYLPLFLRKVGNYRAMLFVLAAETIALLLLALMPSPFVSLLLLFVHLVAVLLVSFNLDVFLEAFSGNEETGTVRGLLLTVVNLAILLGPLAAGIILTNGDFWKVYSVAALLNLPILWILARFLRRFKDPRYERVPVLSSLWTVLRAEHPSDDLRHVVISQFLMQFFFSWMVVYTPIYLHDHIGFAWSEIGVIFAVMLLPYLLFEGVIGRLTDTGLREKTVMAAGFFITALFTALLALPNEPRIVLWTALLFGTRVGMSFVEITTESYFFRRIKGRNTALLSVFRNARPIAYIAGPLSGAIFLSAVPLKFLFLILAACMAYGFWNSATLIRAQVMRAQPQTPPR